MKKAFVLLSAAGILGTSFLNLGVIHRKEDPILKTQTDPVLYKQKEEEMKEGPKGAPTPSFNLYPKERFFTDPAVDSSKTPEQKPDSLKENVSETEVTPNEDSEEWWTDDTSNPERASKS